jgi:hypothetical protein
VESGERGFHGVGPIPAYADIYPDVLDRDAIAYFFDYDAPATLPDAAYEEVTATVEEWQSAWNDGSPPFLVFQRGAGRLTVTDGRNGSGPRVLTFGELEANVYESCTRTAHSPGRITRVLAEERSIDASPGEVEAVLAEFVDARVMLEDDGQYLGLALPVNGNW